VRGRDYYSAEYYDARWLENSGCAFLGAFDDDGTLAGVVAGSRGLFDEECATISLLTTNGEYAGQGVATTLATALFELLASRGVRAVKGQPVMRHTAAQKILDKLAFTPTGILRAARGGNNTAINGEGKGSLALYAKKISAQNAGTIYIHEKIADAARLIYSELEVEVNIIEGGQRHSGGSRTRHYFDAHNSVLYIEILKCGEDITKELKALQALQCGKDPSLVVLLSISDPSAVFGCAALCDAGFEFSGFDPLGKHEHAIFCKNNAKLAQTKMTENLQNLLVKIGCL